MASSGKKGKTKWKSVETSQILNPTTTRKATSSSWADESSADLDDSYDFGRKADITLPTAPRAARGPENDAKIPHDPPFQAYLSNLSYDVTEDDLAAFFAEMKVKNVRLPKDDRGNTMKAKGFGYVEFEDRGSLVEALNLPDTNLKNRRMRIEVADNTDQGRGRGGMRDRNPNEPDRTMGDWRSGPRAEADSSYDRDGYRSAGPRRDFGSDRSGGGMYGDRDRRGGGFRDEDRGGGGGGVYRSRDGDRPSFRDGDRPSFRDGDRPSFRDGDRPSFRDGDRPSFRDGDRPSFRDNRGGGFRDGDRGGFRDGDRGGGFRDGDRGGFRDDRGGGGYRDNGDRFERRGYDDRRGGDFGGGDRERGGGGGGGGGTWRRDRDPEPPRVERERERDPGPTPEKDTAGEPKTRTRLNLQPRSRPVEERVAEEAPAAATPAPAAASIFGGARPVDTAAREREIEERLAKQREDRPAAPRDDSRVPSSQPHAASAASREPPSKEDQPASPPLEPAPPPRENVWAKRSQQTTSQVNNGRISPHEDGETHKHRNTSPSNEPRKYVPRRAQDDKRRDEPGRGSGTPRGGGPPRGGGGPRHVDSRQAPPPKTREPRKETSDETIKMPKVQEHQAPNFVGSNKFAFLEDTESAAD